MKSRAKAIISGVYLCLYDQGTLKIGRGGDVHTRLSAHKSAGNIFGAQVVRTDIVECQNHVAVEKKLIEWCKRNSTSTKSNEWFQGVDYEECLAQVSVFLHEPEQEAKKKRSATEVLAYLDAHFNGKPLPFILDCNKKVAA